MVFIVVPAYNEAKKIGRVIRDLFQHGYENVVIVDDGSSDDTYVEAKKTGASVLRHEVNRGQGAALQTGNEFALARGARLIAHFDADEQMNAGDIGGAIEKMRQENLDVVLGSRFLGRATGIPWTKKFFILPSTTYILYLHDLSPKPRLSFFTSIPIPLVNRPEPSGIIFTFSTPRFFAH